MQQVLRAARRATRCLCLGTTRANLRCVTVAALAPSPLIRPLTAAARPLPAPTTSSSSNREAAAAAAAGPCGPARRMLHSAVIEIPLRRQRGLAPAAATSNRGGAAGPRDAAAPVGASFADFGLPPSLLKALEEMGITQPTEIQALSIPALVNHPANYFLASHTGSGKTLAYLLPLVQLIKAEEAAGFVPRPKRPRVLVLGPTKELTEQITRVAKGLCHHAKFRAACVNAYKTLPEQAKQLSGPLDVLVATPTRLLQHVKEGNVAYRDVRWLVIDEADTVFSQGWAAEVATVLAALRAKPDPAHVLMVSATLTKPIQRAISEYVPDVKELKTSTLHRAVGGSRHVFVVQPPGANKLQMLAETLAADRRRSQKVLVFCSTVDSARAVEHHCKEEGLPCVCYHGTMPMSERQEAMAAFSGGPSMSDGLQPIMIASDLAARGLDFPGQIDHVINFDFPTTSVDYLHRTGRTARAGNAGRITSIVTKKDRVLAQRIQWALEHDEPLDALSAEKERLPPSQVAVQRRERANAKEREATAVLGAKGMARLRRAAAGPAKPGGAAAGRGAGRLRLRGVARPDGAAAGGAGADLGGRRGGAAGGGSVNRRKTASAASAAPTIKGPVRGAARQALMEERLQQHNASKGKRGPPRAGGARKGGPGGAGTGTGRAGGGGRNAAAGRKRR